jgi:hypothetical protein
MKFFVVMPGLVPGIPLRQARLAFISGMPGTSPAMTGLRIR